MSPFLTFGNIRRRNIYPSPTALPPTSPPLPPPPSYQSIQEQDQKPSLHRYFIQQKLTTHEFIHLLSLIIIVDLTIIILVHLQGQLWLPFCLSSIMWYIVGDGQSYSHIPVDRYIFPTTFREIFLRKDVLLKSTLRTLAWVNNLLFSACLCKVLYRLDTPCV
ncbi:hypothetical protein I203_104504 [Kwoniella mangroviensis CBS 8507]|uniref:uncharacterized protein n=1 Tax=Kwoniella mangroviensis CBS 8507 TaxID=1296122 RepID=UPI00080D10A7|nr:uncharacterized protein I203_00552 [Kwoniella mangroviensis CBS 8507]OCF70418.1 hypothetical protein I203_00552 [Kwoniella mangroviensis CBS 8507]